MELEEVSEELNVCLAMIEAFLIPADFTRESRRCCVNWKEGETMLIKGGVVDDEQGTHDKRGVSTEDVFDDLLTQKDRDGMTLVVLAVQMSTKSLREC